MKRLAWIMGLTMAGLVSSAVQAAEEVILTDFDGRPQTIQDYAGKGKWLVVQYWAHDCGICNQEAPNYARFHDEHAEQDAQVLGISIDGAGNRAEAEAYIARHELTFPNLIGEPVPVMLNFMSLTQESFRGTPTFLLYSPDGTLKAAQAGAVPVESIKAYIARNSSS
ncbi:MAG: TlpA family protein disulfide reductase [Gammaproteobacteria bacterium]|nr:TlpA family protein disulfide reductase [Gammaproteobacteria bacterium]